MLCVPLQHSFFDQCDHVASDAGNPGCLHVDLQMTHCSDTTKTCISSLSKGWGGRGGKGTAIVTKGVAKPIYSLQASQLLPPQSTLVKQAAVNQICSKGHICHHEANCRAYMFPTVTAGSNTQSRYPQYMRSYYLQRFLLSKGQVAQNCILTNHSLQLAPGTRRIAIWLVGPMLAAIALLTMLLIQQQAYGSASSAISECFMKNKSLLVASTPMRILYVQLLLCSYSHAPALLNFFALHLNALLQTDVRQPFCEALDLSALSTRCLRHLLKDLRFNPPSASWPLPTCKNQTPKLTCSRFGTAV